MISVVLAAELPITDDINAIAARLVAHARRSPGHLPCYGPDWGLTSGNGSFGAGSSPRES
jgi:hypothetical protein